MQATKNSHTYIYKLVQVAEDAYFRKLGYACEKHKLQMCVGAFENTVEAFQYISDFPVNIRLMHCIDQHRCYSISHRLTPFSVCENSTPILTVFLWSAE
jgi:hypothetical protein